MNIRNSNRIINKFYREYSSRLKKSYNYYLDQRIMTHEIFIKTNNRTYTLQYPISVSRTIVLNPQYESTGAFHLPSFSTSTFEAGDFVGDLKRGGSCRVDIHSYSPHNFTHIESCAHIDITGNTLDKIDRKKLSGIVFLADLSSVSDDFVEWDHLIGKFDYKKLDALAIKTSASLLPQDHDFTQSDFMAIHQTTAQKLFDMDIDLLILDLPSMDKETDNTLSSHKIFFGSDQNVNTQKTIIELAYFQNLEEGYYYYVLTPPILQTDATITDIWFYTLENYSDQGSN